MCLESESHKQHWYSQHRVGCKTCTCAGDSITFANYLLNARTYARIWKSRHEGDDEEEYSDFSSNTDDDNDSNSYIDDEDDSMVSDTN